VIAAQPQSIAVRLRLAESIVKNIAAKLSFAAVHEKASSTESQRLSAMCCAGGVKADMNVFIIIHVGRKPE